MIIMKEPTAIYGEARRFPLSKLDRSATSAEVQPFVDDEEGKLPFYLDLTWPEGNDVTEGESRQGTVTIGERLCLLKLASAIRLVQTNNLVS